MANERNQEILNLWFLKKATERLSRDPSDLEALYERSHAYLGIGELENALYDLNTAVQLIGEKTEETKTDKAFFLTRRAETQELLGNREEAVRDYTEVINLGEHDTDVIFRRGYCYRELGEYQDALNDFCEYLSKEPTDVIALFNRAVTYQSFRDYTQALNDFDEVV